MNILWTAAFFPKTGEYHVYHTYNTSRNIFSIGSSGVRYGKDTHSRKYTYLNIAFKSIDIMFKIRDITLEDAGYYNGGTMTEHAISPGGVLVIVFGINFR